MAVHLNAKIDGWSTAFAAGYFQFPGGEQHLRNLINVPVDAWIADVRGASAEDLMIAAMLADVARQRDERFVLLLPYIPAARADRGEPLGSSVYARVINTMDAAQVIGIDPHSQVVCPMIGGLDVLSPLPLMERALADTLRRVNYDAVIAPDAGALVRASAAAERMGVDVYHAHKHRNFETGAIEAIEMTERLPQSGNYLVVDDICDGGGTFVGIANATGLHKAQLGLWVTHGIFSGNATVLQRWYSRIMTTDSHPGHRRVGVATTIVPTRAYMTQNIKDFE